MNDNPSNSNKNMFIFVGFGIVGLILLLALAGSGKTPAQDDNNMQMTEKVPQESSSDTSMTTGNVVEFTIEAGAFYYKPNMLKVKEGDTVKVTLNSVDMMHNFYLDAFNVKSNTPKSGESTTFEFVASKKGTYEFYCAVGQHRANGQVGTLVVE